MCINSVFYSASISNVRTDLPTSGAVSLRFCATGERVGARLSNEDTMIVDLHAPKVESLLKVLKSYIHFPGEKQQWTTIGSHYCGRRRLDHFNI